MEIFQLECFSTLSENLSFTQTAQTLYITQPALSRSIAALEAELGVELLVRNRRSVKLTAAGEAFARECSTILESYRHGVVSAREAAEGKKGTIRIGLQRDVFEPFSVDFLTAFGKHYPDIGFDIRLLGISELLSGLGNGLEAVIAAGQPQLEDYGTVLLRERQDCVVVRPDHPLANRRSVRMAELKDEKFIGMSRYASSYGHDTLMQKAIEANFEPNIVAEVDYVPGVMMLVACGKGISILHKDLKASAAERLRFIPIEDIRSFKRFLFWDRNSGNPCLPTLAVFAEEWAKASYDNYR